MENTLKLQLQEIAPELTDGVLEKLCLFIRDELSYENRIARLETFMDFVLTPQVTPLR